MKKNYFFLAVVALLLSIFSFAQSNRYSYKTEKVADDIYVLEPAINGYRWVTANIVVVINNDDVFVVDSGLLPSAAEEAIKEIKKLTNKPVRYLLNTHWHGDHWQGNEVFAREFPGIRIIASERCKQAIERNGMYWVNMFYPKYLKMMIDIDANRLQKNDTASTDKMSDKQKNYIIEGLRQIKLDSAEMKTLKPVVPNTTFTDKMVISTGNRDIELYYLGVGNTVGDAVAYLPKEKILITGDLVVYPSPYESGAFSKEWIATSQKLQTNFKYDILIPGHGIVQHDTTYLEFLNALFKEIARQMSNAFAAGNTDTKSVKELVTHKTVIDELNKDPRFTKYTSQLQPDFVPAAIESSFHDVKIRDFVN